MEDIGKQIDLLSYEVKELRKNYVELHSLIMVNMEKYMTKDKAEDSFYSRGEIDRATEAIKDFTKSVKELLEIHVNDTRSNIAEIKSDITSIKEEIEQKKDKWADRVVDFGKLIIVFLLGLFSQFIFLKWKIK